jgi:hypothetical protein
VTSPSPAVAYYEHVTGKWRGDVDFRIVDGAAFSVSTYGWFDRLNLRLTHLAVALGLPLKMETEVWVESPTVIQHRTWMRLFGVALMASREVMRIHEDGRRFLVEAEMRMGPGPARPFGESDGVVGEDARSATYCFGWLGDRMTQTARAINGEVRLTQRGPGWAGDVVLHRR